MSISALMIRGPYLGPTGYDRHVRAFTRELARSGIGIQLIGMPEWSARRLPGELQDPWFRSLKHPTGARVFLQFCMPHQVQRKHGLTSVNFTMFEATRIPRFWVSAASRSALTVLPTHSSLDAWVASGVGEERLRLCPLGIDASLFAGEHAPLELDGPDGEPVATKRVRMLNLSEIVPRKNQRGLLHAWLRATWRDDDAILIVKLGGHFENDRQIVRDTMNELEIVQGKSFSHAAPVLFLDAVYADEEMPRLFAAATHYISMSFGEGWDLPMMEAAASGLQLIAPNHSAYQSYLNPSIASLIPVKEIPADVEGELRLYFHSASWWEPDLDAAATAIRNAIDGHEGAVASPRDFVLGTWTWENATRRLIEILEEAESFPLQGSNA